MACAYREGRRASGVYACRRREDVNAFAEGMSISLGIIMH